jgi:hypothetical protein
MKLPIIAPIFLSLLISTLLSAQNKEFNYAWGEIEQEQLEMLQYDKDTSANSVGLLNYSKVYYDDYNDRTRGMFYKYHIRIKVLDKSKFEEADIKLLSTYYSDIQLVKAQTINWDGSQKVVYEVKDIYEKELAENVKSYSFSFPNIQNGSILEYQYVVFALGYKALKTFHFQNERPNLWSEYRVAIPEGRSYTILLQGTEKPINKGSQDFENKTVPFESVEYYWVYKDVPSMKTETYTTTIENYISKIDLQLDGEVANKGYSSTNNYSSVIWTTSFLKSWEALGRYYFINHYLPLLGEFYQIKPVFTKVKPLLADCKTEKDTILTIYNYVKENIEWTGQIDMDISSEEKPRDIFDKGKGTSGEINLSLFCLLHHFGVEAYPVLLSTRKHGKINHAHPFFASFNHVIIAANVNSEWLYLDAIDKNLPYNLLPTMDYNYEGLLMKKDTAYFIPLAFETSETATFMKAKLNADGSLKGSLNIMETNFDAHQTRKKIATAGESAYQKEYFTNKWVDAKVENISIKNLGDNTQRLTQTIAFSAENVGQVAGDLMYMDLFMGLGMDENPFKLETRNYPIELPFSIKKNFVLNIELPEGYIVESLPEGKKYVLPNGEGSYIFSIEEKNGVIVVSSRMIMNSTKFETYQYEGVKGLFTNLIEAQTAQVVLKKKG